MQHGCAHVHPQMAALPEDHPLRLEARDTKVGGDEYHYTQLIALYKNPSKLCFPSRLC